MKNLDGTETLTLVVSGEFADKVTDIAESKSISITKVMVHATENCDKLLDALKTLQESMEETHKMIGSSEADKERLKIVKNAIKKATE